MKSVQALLSIAGLLLIPGLALAQDATDDAAPAAEESDALADADAADAADATGETDDAPVETAETEDAGEAEVMPLPAASEDPPDVNAPIIEDLAVAAGNPRTPPMITAVITDDWSGVEQATIFFRAPGEVDFKKATLEPGSGGLFIARLPEGTQREGFQYYVEVFDAAKNGPSRLGSPLEPFEVGPADIGTLDRIERERQRAELGPIHPAWMMVSLGTGIVAGAGTGVFLIDIFANVNPNLEQAQMVGDTDAVATWERARLADATIASVLGVISAAGLATGIGLLIYAGVAE